MGPAHAPKEAVVESSKVSAASNIQAPLRVLHVYAGNLYGGIETFLRTLAEERHQCPEMEPEFALCFEGRLADEIRASGAPLHMLGGVRLSRPWTVLRAQSKLLTVLKTTRPDVVVCHAAWPYTIFAPVVRLSNTRLAFYRHDIGGPRDWMNLFAGRVKPDIVIANSDYTARNAYPKFPRLPSTVVHCAVRASATTLNARQRNEFRRELGAGDHDVVILQVSRLQRGKGHHLLLEALSKLPDDVTWKCWIVGTAQRKSERAALASLREFANVHSISQRVHFLGERKDISKLMAAADLFCQPNVLPESFGIVFVEALSAGLPIVTTDAAGGALEIVDATCSRIASPNATDLSAAVSAMVGSEGLSNSLKDNARTRADKFTQVELTLTQLKLALARAEPSILARS